MEEKENILLHPYSGVVEPIWTINTSGGLKLPMMD
jgi:hypothetical protein